MTIHKKQKSERIVIIHKHQKGQVITIKNNCKTKQPVRNHDHHENQ